MILAVVIPCGVSYNASLICWLQNNNFARATGEKGIDRHIAFHKHLSWLIIMHATSWMRQPFFQWTSLTWHIYIFAIVETILSYLTVFSPSILSSDFIEKVKSTESQAERQVVLCRPFPVFQVLIFVLLSVGEAHSLWSSTSEENWQS